MFESNHDVSMLQMGRYPWSVKRRILSDVGHVSNEDAAVAMSEVVDLKNTHIYLSHLSKDNNMKDLARMSVTQTLQSCGIVTGEYVHLHDTDANRAYRTGASLINKKADKVTLSLYRPLFFLKKSIFI